MNEDRLNEFVRNNRQGFDDKIPAEGNWKRIRNTLFAKESVTLWNMVSFWRIAALLLLCTTLFLFFSRPAVRNEKAQAYQQEFTDIESFYSAQIIEKAALISKDDLFADDSYSQDIQKLEAMYTVMSDEMKRHPSEKVKDALVLNMLVRIDLMNQQIQKLEETRKKKVSATTI